MAQKKQRVTEKTQWLKPRHPKLTLNLEWESSLPYLLKPNQGKEKVEEKNAFLSTYKFNNKKFQIKEYFTLHQTIDNGLFEIYININ